MLKRIRVLGLIVFACLMSFSAHSLIKMYRSGALFEQYNNDRKSNITLFSVSVFTVIAISAYEIRRYRRSHDIYPEYRPRHRPDGNAKEDDANRNSCIYSGRESFDSLPNRTTPEYLAGGGKRPPTKAEVWMKMLRIICLVIPPVNLILFTLLYTQNFGNPQNQWIFPALCSVYVFFGVMAATGIFNKRKWGLSAGYLVAIINLILFPVGTAMALFLLMSLMGAAPVFAKPKRIRMNTT
jgi:hypothetical protein